MMWRSLLFLLAGVTGSALAAPLVEALPATPAMAHTLPRVTDLAASAPDADPKVLGRALQAMQCAAESGMPSSQRLAVIDYSLPSSKPRLWVFDLASGQLLFRELVAHGRNTGDNDARFFSNEMNSRSSSIGLFRTLDTYEGSNGYSLRLEGLERGFNDRAYDRAIVMHGAPYVNEEHVKKFGRLGRSWGCPAVRMGVAKRIIDSMKGGQFVFSYYPDSHWLSASQYLNCGSRTASL